MVDKCYALAEKWESGSEVCSNFPKLQSSLTPALQDFTPSPSDIAGWSGNQLVVFLERLQISKISLTAAQSKAMGFNYSLVNTQNVEISSRYFGVGLRAKDESVYQPTADLLGQVGRMKFVRPLYRGLAEVDRELALKTFEKNRDFYHPICRGLVEKDLAKMGEVAS
jgi:leukotriene-A4 hydrolase